MLARDGEHPATLFQRQTPNKPVVNSSTNRSGAPTLEDVSQREWVRPGGVGGLHGGTLTEPGVHVHGRATGGGFTGECPRAPFEPEPIEPDFRGKSTPKSTTFRHSPPSPIAVNRQGCVAAGRDGRCRGSQTCRGAIRRGRVSPGRTEEAVLRATAGTCPISNPNIDVTKFNRAPPVDPYPPSPRHSHWPGPTGIG